jgi:hypothetical protein
VLEKVIQDAEINARGIILQRSQHIIGYAVRNQRKLETILQQLEDNARQLGLKVNGDTLHQQIGKKVNIGKYNFGMVTAKGNDNSLEFNSRIIMANRFFYGLNKLKKSKSLPRSAKRTLYKSIVIPVLMYGSESWTMSGGSESAVHFREEDFTIDHWSYLRQWGLAKEIQLRII